MAEGKEKKQKKKIPDYARRDIVGVYYSQMKLWQGAFFLSVVVAGILAYALVFKTKHHYFLTDGYQIVRLEETSPRVDLFLQESLKKLFNLSYTDFDQQLVQMKDYLTAETFQQLVKGLSAMKGDFLQVKKIWIPSTPVVYTTQKKDRVIFSATLQIKEVSVSMGKEGILRARVEGEVIKATPEGNNLFPYKMRNIKIKFGG
ncbi:hypothetical protein [Persephonella sp.]